MDLVKFSINKPVTVIVGVILVVLFGLIGLKKMPYQLTPTVTEALITVSTTWTGATPYEIEREIIEEQENVLKGIPGLMEMESSSFNSRGSITLKFSLGTDIDDALLRVSNKLNEVRNYPENVDKPTINATGAATSPVIWMVIKSDDDNPRHVSTYKTYFENDIRQYLERVKGVADLFMGGGREEEMHVIIKPEKLAAYGLTVNDVINVLRAENANVSAGSMSVGRRDYRVRTVAEFKTEKDIRDVVIKSEGQRRIKVSDIAVVEPGYTKKSVVMMHNHERGIAVGIKPELGANILTLTDTVEEVVNWLNEKKLKQHNIHIDWVYDQRPYINGAIGLVRQNILIGGFLALAVLLIFLRSFSSTVVVSMAIPVSVIGTFIFMNGMGRNLNVVSLAGISFAVGMLVDNAIVVLENIDRHRKMGKSPFDSAYDGTREVWGAILASTVTTVAVFLPVAFMEEEAGQLFRDIAIAVTFSVVLSLIVSVTVIPMLSKQLFGLSGKDRALDKSSVAEAGHKIAGAIMRLVSFSIQDWKTRLGTIVLLTTLSIITVYFLIPKMEYLPQGNRNLVINFLIPPPGLSYEERESIGDYLFDSSAPYFGEGKDGVPGINRMFYVGSESFMISGAIAEEEDRAGELVPVFQKIVQGIPGFFGVSNQAGIFQTGLGRGRTIDVDVSADDLNRIIGTAGAMFGMIRQEIEGVQVRPVPSLELLYPEVRIEPDREKLNAAGLSARQLGVIIDVFMDGRRISDFKGEGKKKVDLVVKASDSELVRPEQVYDLPIVTSKGKIIPVSSVSNLISTSGITEVRHLERRRTITLQVTPPMTLPLEEAMDTISNKIIPKLEKMGMMKGIDVNLSGAADKLTQTRKALQWNFLLAILITYLLMSALFANFLYPLIIMFTVPLASAGGILGLRAVDTFLTPQPLDILTMVGFVILIGVVVNNAILIVHQSLENVRHRGMNYDEAVLEATRVRLRPIYMSAFTSVLGMLPLVVIPGPGSELYRGLGSVVLGGLAFSTIFTIFVIPSLLMFFIGMEKRNP